MGWLISWLMGGGAGPLPGPCAGGTWGSFDPEAIQVRLDGDDLGSGTPSDPVATLRRALELAAERPPPRRKIGVGPGLFTGGLELAGPGLERVSVAGCGIGATTLVAGPAVPVIRGAERGALADLTLQGGRVGLLVEDRGAWSLERVEVRDPVAAGVVVAGVHAHAELVEVQVLGPASAGDCGAALAVEEGSLVGVGVDLLRAAGMGVWSQAGQVELTVSTVGGVGVDGAGRPGRGIQAQAGSRLQLEDVQLAGQRGEGVFLVDSWGDLRRIVIDFTGAGLLDVDGVVFVGGLGRPHRLEDSRVFQAARMGWLVDGGDLEAEANAAFWEPGYVEEGIELGVQRGGRVRGADRRDAILLVEPVELDTAPRSCRW